MSGWDRDVPADNADKKLFGGTTQQLLQCSSKFQSSDPTKLVAFSYSSLDLKSSVTLFTFPPTTDRYHLHPQHPILSAKSLTLPATADAYSP